MRCLVLNVDYTFLSIDTWFDALCQVIAGKARVLETYNKEIRSQYLTWKCPAIIITNDYKMVKKRRRNFAANTRNVLIRDEFKCAYCGCKITLRSGTKDHIIPESRGGKTTMLNLIASCKPCNSRKDNKTLKEAGMTLLFEPRELSNEERLQCIVKGMQSRERLVWNNWLKENNVKLW
jgi:5-methylcytosine-specific restriction endonuclease McrA